MRKDKKAALTSARTEMNAMRANYNDITKEKKTEQLWTTLIFKIINKGPCKRNVTASNLSGYTWERFHLICRERIHARCPLMSQTNEERKGHLSLLLSYLFGTHRFKHLLKLDTQLLDIIHQDARLRTKREIQTALLEETKKHVL